MADQATPNGGDTLTISRDDVSAVHRTADERLTEALEKGRTDTDEVVLDGGIPNRSIKEAFAAAQKRKENDLAWEILAALPSNETLHEWLDDAQEKLNEAKRLIAEMRAYEGRLYQTPDGKTDWGRIAREHLSKEKFDSANGDPAILVALLQEQFVDEHGQPVDDSDLAMALARRAQAEEALNKAQEEIHKVDEAHEADAGNDETRQRLDQTKTDHNDLEQSMGLDFVAYHAPKAEEDLSDITSRDNASTLAAQFSGASNNDLEDISENEREFEGEDLQNPFEDNPFGSEESDNPFGSPEGTEPAFSPLKP